MKKILLTLSLLASIVFLSACPLTTREDMQHDQDDQREMKEQLLSMMDHLGESCRKILTFFYYENLPFEQIIRKMGYETEQVARNKKYKCMKELSDLIRNNPALLKRIE